ncbi:MAG: DUF2948 family protein [Micropepsaceae bacterium]
MPAAPAPLRLAAEDAEDLKAISALLQDAVLTLADMAYLKKARRFALVLNRFRWEADGQGRNAKTGTRIRSGLHIENVLKVEARGIPQDAKDTILSLLALTFEPGEDGQGTLTLQFSAGKALRLHVEALDATLTDLSDAWAAKARPDHGDA